MSGSVKEGLIPFAADEGEVFVAAGLLVDDGGKLLFSGAQFAPGNDALGFEEALFDDFGAAGLDGEVGLRKRNLRLLGIAVLSDEVAA